MRVEAGRARRLFYSEDPGAVYGLLDGVFDEKFSLLTGEGSRNFEVGEIAGHAEIAGEVEPRIRLLQCDLGGFAVGVFILCVEPKAAVANENYLLGCFNFGAADVIANARTFAPGVCAATRERCLHAIHSQFRGVIKIVIPGGQSVTVSHVGHGLVGIKLSERDGDAGDSYRRPHAKGGTGSRLILSGSCGYTLGLD